MSRSQRRRLIGLGLLAIFALLVLIILRHPRTNSAEDTLDRRLFGRELVAEGRLVGLTQAEATQLLGPPDHQLDPSSKWSLGWYLGTRESAHVMFFPYEEYLVVKLEDGLVRDAWIVDLD